MSVLDLPLRKALQLFYAPDDQRRQMLVEDIRLDRIKAAGGSRSRGGDFHSPFWSDVKRHLNGNGDLTQMIEDRVASNKFYRRLYPQLRDGILELLTEKLRWSNEPVEIIPESVSGRMEIEALGATIRVKDAIHARIRGEYTRIVYPYFSEQPPLPEEGGRLGLWAMQQSLSKGDPADMRIVDVLRRVFYSPQNVALRGDENAIFSSRLTSLVAEWNSIRDERR